MFPLRACLPKHGCATSDKRVSTRERAHIGRACKLNLPVTMAILKSAELFIDLLAKQCTLVMLLNNWKLFPAQLILTKRQIVDHEI